MPLQGIRTGVDLVDIPRFRHIAGQRGEAFLTRLFTQAELAGNPAVQSLAARFAAKEAFLKALGTGLSQGVTWHDIEVIRDDDGPPGIRVGGRAAELLGGRSAALSISHTGAAAVAFVIISDGHAT